MSAHTEATSTPRPMAITVNAEYSDKSGNVWRVIEKLPFGRVRVIDDKRHRIGEMKFSDFRLSTRPVLTSARSERDDLLTALHQSFDFPPSFFAGRTDDEIVTITVTGRHLNLVSAALAKASA
jgi:hypothetical protein